MLEVILNSERPLMAADSSVFCCTRELPRLTVNLRWQKAPQGRVGLGNHSSAHLGLEGNDYVLKCEAETSSAFLWPPAQGYNASDTDAINPFEHSKKKK